MLAFYHQLRRKQKKVKHLEDEDREFLHFLLSLESDEFKMMLDSMTDEDAMRVLVMVQQAKDEMFDEWMEENGMPEANDVIKMVM
jgi:hypothetical protein